MFSFKNISHDFVDIDDCNPNPCANGGTCTDGVDSYTCQCAAGYTGPNCNTSKCSYTPVILKVAFIDRSTVILELTKGGAM